MLVRFSLVFLILGCLAGSVTLSHAAMIGPDLVYDDERADPLTKNEIAELQLRLGVLGFDAGRPDGIAGPRTRSMIERLSRSTGTNIRDQRHALKVAREETAVRTIPAHFGERIPPCEAGLFTGAALYSHLKAYRIWGDPVSRDLIDADRGKADWVEVICRDERLVERVDLFRRGELQQSVHYTYRPGVPAPLQMQYRDPEGKITNTIHIGRTSNGSLTHLVGIGESGEPNRLIAVIGVEEGTRTDWITFDTAARVTSRSLVSYDPEAQTISGLTVYRGADFTHKYVYFYPPESLHSNGFERYEGDRKVHIAELRLDAFGRTVEERIRIVSGGGTYYNRYYDNGNLVREERDDAQGNAFEYLRDYTDQDYLAHSRLVMNGRHIGDIEVIRDGVEVEESRLVLPDGSVYARYPGHAVYSVERDGRPTNGGAHRALSNRPLW